MFIACFEMAKTLGNDLNNMEFKAVTISKKKGRISSTQLVKNQSQGILHFPHAKMASGEKTWVSGCIFSHVF